MSISSDQNRRTYSGDGSSAVFNYQYEFHNDSDLAVLVYNSSRTTITVAQALTTNYTISGTKDLQGRYLNGADVVFNSSPATGDEISIFGSTAVNSAYALGFNEHISRPDLVKALDHLVLINQRLNNQATRSVRLRDSYPYTFDTSLPERLTPNAPIIVNSGGVGFNTGLITNSSGFAGIFPMANGGTGANLVPSRGQLLYADSTTTMNLFGAGGQDQVVIAQSSNVPIFSSVNLASGSSVRNLLAATRGGTAHSSFVSASMVYASSTSILSFIANGGVGQPLVGNNGGAPSFQAIDLASGSSVSGILTTSRGGTGNSGYVQYGVAYFETATQIAVVPSGINGRVLTCHGSSAPTFDAVPSDALIAPVRATTTYVVTTSDETILCDGSSAAFFVRLPNASATSGQHFYVKKIDSSTNVITIDGSSSQTIEGTSLILAEQYDSARVLSDGTEWHVISRHFHGRRTSWTSWTPTGSWTTGTTVYTGYWRRIGDEMEINAKVLTNAPPNAVGFTLNLPGTYTINTAKLANGNGTEQILGYGFIFDSGGSTFPAFPRYTGTSSIRVDIADDAVAALAFGGQITNTVPMSFNTDDFFTFTARVPITNWTGEGPSI